MRDLWFENQGVKLFACDDGAGPAVVMLHGGLANHLASRPLLGNLESRFRLLCPDLRGSGKSWFAGELGWDQWADDVIGLLDHLGVERAVVGGVSSGSGAAVRFALRHPRRIRGLVLVSPVHGGAAQGLTAQQAATFEMMDGFGRKAAGEGIRALRPLYENLPSPMRERALSVIEDFHPASVAATTRFLASGAQPFQSIVELQSVAIPTLLLPGNDALHPPEISKLYAENIPDCTVKNVDRTEMAAVIGEFCESRVIW